MKILLVAGTRPDFVKIASLMHALNQPPDIEPILVHTGQHSDWRMSGLFFHQLAIPDPDENLDIDGSSLAAKLASVVMRFETLLLEHRPDCILVLGDVQHAIGCVLLAAQMRIKVIHVEAGLRGSGRARLEEIERIIADHMSDLLFCTEQSGVDNLLREGIPQSKIHLVGNVMIDTLLRFKNKANASKILPALELPHNGYAVLTMHHDQNLEDSEAFSRIFSAMKIIGRDMPIVFPIHPKCRQRLSMTDLSRNHSEIRFIDPLGYNDFIKLVSSARVVMTDSGGVQEETTLLDVPCLTLRDGTDRPCTVEVGSNYVVGSDPDRIVDVFRSCLNGGRKKAGVPLLWDGQASGRIRKALEERI